MPQFVSGVAVSALQVQLSATMQRRTKSQPSLQGGSARL